MSFWPMAALGLLLLGIGYVVGFVHGYEAFSLSNRKDTDASYHEIDL
jgi:hypothetical protein